MNNYVDSLAAAFERARALPVSAGREERLVSLYGVVLECSIPRATRGTGTSV
jgi:hypothetical protein